MRVLILLALAACAVAAAIVYPPALAAHSLAKARPSWRVAQAVSRVLVAAERVTCGGIEWAIDLL